MNFKCLLISFLSILFLFASLIHKADAQGTDEEVFLQFRHQGIVNTYISTLYHQDQFYLSIGDIFSALAIDHEIDSGTFTITGNYLGKGRYRIDLNNQRATFLDLEFDINADQFAITDFGFYLTPEVFYKLFEMEFIIDFGDLLITLESDDTMPVVAQRERERQRERMMRTQRELRRDFYPVRYDRNPQLFDGGFFDYNLTANITQGTDTYVYNTNIGTELLYGDLQGNIFGSYSATATTLRSSGLRWRYGIRDNDYISTIIAGQTTAEGLAPVAYTGIKVTNDPIEPRFLYGETAFTGTVEPNSEVELYRNNSLVDYAEADETGQYRFTVPVTYGSSQYSIRVFSPTGEVSQRDARLQIPFNFIPPGEFTYTVDAGRLDNPIAGSTERGYVTKANVSAGITQRLTASGGVEYFEDFHESLPTFTGRLSGRLFTNHLISVEAANDAFYRASLSAIYPNNASINLDYTHFNTMGGVYNPGRNESAVRANIFTPFEIRGLPLFLRWSVTNEQRAATAITRYRVDLNTRLGRANFRMGFRDSQIGRLNFEATPTARVNASAAYNFTRSRQTPTLLQGVFTRAQLNYVPSLQEIEDAELQVSRSISRRGRFQVAAGRNFIGNFNLFRFTLNFDFSAVRSNTSIRTSRNTSTVSQSFRGSIGYDSNNSNVLFTNRQQVGRSGVAVRMFVDNNNSGTFDEGDELIQESAARIDRAGGSRFSKNGVSYISQLQPYRQYNMTINKSSLNNPLLVPTSERFSIITDPNQYKLIEIPFYMSGIIDGMVYRMRDDGSRIGLGGMRLYLNQINVDEGVTPHIEELRTFSDGSFYAYEIPPGDYQIIADPSQLNFLNAISDPEALEFTVQALAEGDFVEGLEISIYPEDFRMPDYDPVIIAAMFSDQVYMFNTRDDTGCSYRLDLATFRSFPSSIQYADELEDILGEEVLIEYNSGLNLNLIRTSDNYSISEAIELAESAIDDVYLPFTATLMCADPSYEYEEDKYIQLGKFDREQDAEALAAEIDDRTYISIPTLVNRLGDSYQALAGPFSSETELKSYLYKILQFDDFYPPDVPDLPTDILTEEVETEPEEREEEILDLILTEVPYTTLPDTVDEIDITEPDVETRYVLPSVLTFTPAIADLLNLEFTKPVDTTDVTDREITVLHPVLPPVTIDTDTLTTITEDPDTTEITDPVRTRRVLIPPLPTVTPAPPIDTTRVFVEADDFHLANCSFPVQVGSYGGHVTAQNMADSLGNILNVDIGLYFNDRTDLFALRTKAFSTVEDAFKHLKKFKETEQFIEVAIVSVCFEENEEQIYKQVQYLIPMIRYNHEEQARRYAAENLSANNIDYVIRKDHSANLYSVFAGPYSRYDLARVVKQNIIEKNINPEARVIIDPETRNNLAFQFQLYLNHFDNENDAKHSSELYLNRTGRDVMITKDRHGKFHLFDSMIYTSWGEFRNQYEIVKDLSGLNFIKMMIYD